METTEQNIINNKILNNPENYAAIYARISSKKDNNSIEAQISKAKMTLKNKNLLLYAIYTDHVSGRTVSPPDRKGFGKLLADAKAKCFKTIIAYKHDRIVRNLSDWIDLTCQLKKLGIKIIFSDESEYTSDNSLQGEFIENLLVMVAELEPNNINERVSNGRKQRRQEGIYNAGNNVPFGYKRIDNNSKNKSNGKSHYEIKPLQAIFIQNLFCEAKDLLCKGDIKIEKIKEKITSFINELLGIQSKAILLSKLISYENNISMLLEPQPEKFLQDIIELLTKYLSRETSTDIKEELTEIRKHLLSTGNIQTILANSIYGGNMLKDSNEEQQGIIINANNIPKLNKESFVKVNNAAQIIDEKTFSKVYPYAIMPKVLKAKEPDFLLKGKLKCGNCNVYLHFKNGLLQCTNVGNKPGCKAYGKSNLIEAVLDVILDDALASDNYSEGFKNFCSSIIIKLQFLERDLKKLRNEKMSLLQEYIKGKKERCINELNDTQVKINLILKKVASYEYEYDYACKFQKLLDHYNKSERNNNNSFLELSKVKSSVIPYIISNEDYFNSIFNELIKEVKVKTIEQKNNVKCQFTIDYEFRNSKPSHLSPCID